MLFLLEVRTVLPKSCLSPPSPRCCVSSLSHAQGPAPLLALLTGSGDGAQGHLVRPPKALEEVQRGGPEAATATGGDGRGAGDHGGLQLQLLELKEELQHLLPVAELHGGCEAHDLQGQAHHLPLVRALKM